MSIIAQQCNIFNYFLLVFFFSKLPATCPTEAPDSTCPTTCSATLQTLTQPAPSPATPPTTKMWHHLPHHFTTTWLNLLHLLPHTKCNTTCTSTCSTTFQQAIFCSCTLCNLQFAALNFLWVDRASAERDLTWSCICSATLASFSRDKWRSHLLSAMVHIWWHILYFKVYNNNKNISYYFC